MRNGDMSDRADIDGRRLMDSVLPTIEGSPSVQSSSCYLEISILGVLLRLRQMTLNNSSYFFT